MNDPVQATEERRPSGETVTAVARQSVEDELAKILASSTFAGSKRLQRFLEYTVTRTLQGEADRIKEYVLGREVFDRSDSYDPRIDPIVRVEARRLRTKLAEYYASFGDDDPVTIRYPKGSYVPSFKDRRAVQPAPGASRSWIRRGPFAAAVLAVAVLTLGALGIKWRLAHDSVGSPEPKDPAAAQAPIPLSTLAVLPLENLSQDPGSLLAETVTEALTTELAKIAGLQVRSRTTTRQYQGTRLPMGEIGQRLAVGAVVEGAVVEGTDRVHVKVRVVDTARDAKVWAESYTCRASDLVGLQAEIARSIALAIERREARRRP